MKYSVISATVDSESASGLTTKMYVVRTFRRYAIM
jgi:hypothetical protein